jgi:hypothetical protein
MQVAAKLVATSKVRKTAKAAEMWLTAVHPTWLLWRTSLPTSFSRSIRSLTCVTDMQPPVHQACFDLSTFGTTLNHEILKILISNGTKIIQEDFVGQIIKNPPILYGTKWIITVPTIPRH